MVSWSRGNKNVTKIMHNNKEVIQITRGNTVIYDGVTVDSVLLSTDKNILSYADGDSALLTATVLDSNGNGISGKTVSFDIVDHDTGEVISNIDTATTDSSGKCNVYYYSNHAGDLYIQAKCGSILSIQTYVEDNTEIDNATPSTHINNFLKTSNDTVTTDSNGITFTQNGGGFVYYPYVFDADEDFEFSMEIGALTSGSQHPYMAPIIIDKDSKTQIDYLVAWSAVNLLSYYPLGSSEQKYRTGWSVGDKFTIKRENGTTYCYLNDVLRLFHTHQYTNGVMIGFSIYNNWNGSSTIKNIKIKRL